MLDPNLQNYLRSLNSSTDPILRAMEEQAARDGFPIVGPEVGRLLCQQASLVGAATVFELGSGFGYSAWWFAQAVGPYGTVHLTDTSTVRLSEARDYLSRSGVWDRCSAHQGDALETFASYEGSADIVFVDIDKADYPAVLPLVEERLRPGGLLLIDNMLWHGRVWGNDSDSATAGVKELTRALWANPRFECTLIPLRDGVVIARYRASLEYG